MSYISTTGGIGWINGQTISDHLPTSFFSPWGHWDGTTDRLRVTDYTYFANLRAIICILNPNALPARTDCFALRKKILPCVANGIAEKSPMIATKVSPVTFSEFPSTHQGLLIVTN